MRKQLVLSFILLGMLLLPTVAVAASADESVTSEQQAVGFNILSAQWVNSAGASEAAAPGSQDVTLTITAQYFYNNEANGIQGVLTLPTGFTDITGTSTSTYYYPLTSGSYVPSGSTISMTFNLDIASNVATGTYNMPLAIFWGAVTPLGNGQQVSVALYQSSIVPVVLNGKAHLALSFPDKSLMPGEINNLTAILTNTGSGPATQVSVSVTVGSANQASSLSGSVLNQLPVITSLGVNQSISQYVLVYVPAQQAGSPISFTFTSDYTDSYGVAETSSVTLGLFVTSATSSTQVSVVPIQTNIPVGSTGTTISYDIVNNGATALYSPSFSLTPPTGLAVIANSTYAAPNAIINPGKSFKFEAVVANGPSTSQGADTFTLSMTYDDQYGTSTTVSLALGAVVTASINMVIQDLAVSQNATAITLSGTLLNEGLGSAYYANIVANVTAGGATLVSGTYYAGEVDPNTPLPFSMTLTSPKGTPLPSETGTLNIGATYQNDFGTALTFNNAPKAISIAAERTTSVNTSAEAGAAQLVDYSRIALAALLIVALVGSYLYVRSYRKSHPKSSDKLKEEKVI